MIQNSLYLNSMTRRVNEILEEVRDANTTRAHEEARSMFREVFPDGFKALPKGFQFRSRDPKGFSISVFANPSKTTLFIQVEGEEQTARGRKRVYNKYQVNRSAELSEMDRPQINGVNETRLLKEILERAQEISLLNWRTTSLDLDPQGEGDEERVSELVPGDRREGSQDIDVERIEILVRHPKVLAQFVNERRGFKGYRLYLLQKGCILESDRMKNAAYAIRFGVSVGKTRRELRTMPDPDLDAMIRSLPGAEFITASKGDKREEASRGPGARVKRIVHIGDWAGRMGQAIEELS